MTLETKEKKPFSTRIRNYFIAGLVILIPITFTVYFTLFIIDISKNLLPKGINPNQYLPFNIPGLEILITLTIIIITGMVSLTYVGKYLLNLNEKIFDKIPFLRSIYKGVGQLTKTFTEGNNKSRKVVLVQFPKEGSWCIGFATNINKGEASIKTNAKLINIFVPTTPNPTSGFLIMVPEKDIIYLDMTFETASKLIMSGGSLDI